MATKYDLLNRCLLIRTTGGELNLRSSKSAFGRCPALHSLQREPETFGCCYKGEKFGFILQTFLCVIELMAVNLHTDMQLAVLVRIDLV